jgi:hypothetical protein
MRVTIQGQVLQVNESNPEMKSVSLLQNGAGSRPEVVGVLFGKQARTPVPKVGEKVTLEVSAFVGKKGGMLVFAA